MAAASQPYLMTISSLPGSERMAVALHGALDRETQEALRRSLTSALRTSVRGIDLDLGDVSFWDCSALNVLLAVRDAALRSDRTVTIRTTSPVVLRVLELTGTLALFAAREA